MVGPSAGVTLLAGIAMVGLTGWLFPLWVVWGLVAVFTSMGMGGTVIRRAYEDLAVEASSGTDAGAGLERAKRRLLQLNAVNVTLLLATVAAMVLKPGW